MKDVRTVLHAFTSKPVMEGAGVHLRRAFGSEMEALLFDPFLLLDDFRSDTPSDYINGFPWHPHRGIETITYVLRGNVEHADSLGNKGVISSGDVQWMTAGSGIIHQEMPKGDREGHMWGFQLWANLPAVHKMTKPKYRGVTDNQIPKVALPGGVDIRVICGKVGEIAGPVGDIATNPEYLDISVPARSVFSHPVQRGHTVLAYVFEGKAFLQAECGSASKKRTGKSKQEDNIPQIVANHGLVLFGDGDEISVTTSESPVRFLLISGKPIREPIAWYGPIVMNTREELRIAFAEYRSGAFIK